MERDCYKSNVRTPMGKVEVKFLNDPMLTVRFECAEPFFQKVQDTWNQCQADRQDPHEPFQQLVWQSSEWEEAERKLFVRDFLQAASSASRELEQGDGEACGSLEHHADLL